MQLAEDKKKLESQEFGSGNDKGTEAETVIDAIIEEGSRSKEVEPVEQVGELKDRGSLKAGKSETSTEDEWERVSENERDK